MSSAHAQDTNSRALSAFEIVADWVLGQPMRTLLAEFGETSPTDIPIGPESTWMGLQEELPDWLGPVLDNTPAPEGAMTVSLWKLLQQVLVVESRIADDFDFRRAENGKYRERAQASSADFTDEFRARIISLADELGLVTPRPPEHGSYDLTLVLGGGYRSPLLRSRLAAQLAAAGTELGVIYSLGSPRFLIEEPAEAPEVADYAPDAHDEFGLMCAGATAEFGVDIGAVEFLCGCLDDQSICPEWPHSDDPDDAADIARTPTEYTHLRSADLIDTTPGRRRGAVLSARTSRPPFRPDTSDTYELLGRVAEPHGGQKALIVTTQVFVPFQRFDGLRRLWLPFGVDVDAVGFGADWGDRPLTAEYLLQEVLSGIRSARRLLVDAADILRQS